MRCAACDHQGPRSDTAKWDEEEAVIFIEVNLKATVEDRGGSLGAEKRIYIYMCPKCGTLKAIS